VKSFGELLEKRMDEADRALGLSLPATWDIGEYSHFQKKRGFGVTFLERGNLGPTAHMRFAGKLTTSPGHRQDGIIQHEIGHVVDHIVPEAQLDRWAAAQGIRLPPQSQAEVRADAIAQAIWEKPIRYDNDLVQSTNRGSWPRPAHLGW
jgi:hypothetical protein